MDKIILGILIFMAIMFLLNKKENFRYFDAGLDAFKTRLGFYKGLHLCQDAEKNTQNYNLLKNIFTLLTKDSFFENINLSVNIKSDIKSACQESLNILGNMSPNVDYTLMLFTNEILIALIMAVISNVKDQLPNRTEMETLMMLILQFANTAISTMTGSIFSTYNQQDNTITFNIVEGSTIMPGIESDKPYAVSIITDKFIETLKKNKMTEEKISSFLKIYRDLIPLIINKDSFTYESTTPCVEGTQLNQIINTKQAQADQAVRDRVIQAQADQAQADQPVRVIQAQADQAELLEIDRIKQDEQRRILSVIDRVKQDEQRRILSESLPKERINIPYY